MKDVSERAAAMTDRELVSWLGIWEQVRRTDATFARIASPGSPAWLAPEVDAAAVQGILRAELLSRRLAKGG
jgi:hypothetical protein